VATFSASKMQKISSSNVLHANESLYRICLSQLTKYILMCIVVCVFAAAAIVCFGVPNAGGFNFTLPPNAEWDCATAIPGTPANALCTARCASGYNLAGGGPYTSKCDAALLWETPTGPPITCIGMRKQPIGIVSFGVMKRAAPKHTTCTATICLESSLSHMPPPKTYAGV
jgi:hypothetical protein